MKESKHPAAAKTVSVRGHAIPTTATRGSTCLTANPFQTCFPLGLDRGLGALCREKGPGEWSARCPGLLGKCGALVLLLACPSGVSLPYSGVTLKPSFRVCDMHASPSAWGPRSL